ncbi:MAG: hypothetical protein KA953_00015 [Lachnospiraceae bacterium]|nr:hypothetical protein [Lachnospiraceae bacterium]
MKKKILYGLYIFCGFAGCFFLFLSMFINQSKIEMEASEKTNTEQSSPAERMDQYLSNNFGLRTEVISFYTKFQERIFSTSFVENVVIGKEGFLYYKDTIDDYCGTNKMSSREIFNTVRTLEMMQENITSQNKKMLFIVAPNKNSLYDYMPSNYRKSKDKSNWERLSQKMSNVSYIDAFDLFRSKKECYYYKTDTHWNDQGAYLVVEKAMDLLGRPLLDQKEPAVFEKNAMTGDLQRMLYPDSKPNESKLVLGNPQYQMITTTRSFEQPYIETNQPNGNGSLVMFRDSFANNMITHLSEQYQYAIYDKNIPYNLSAVDKYQADHVIIEIAERNLNLIQEYKPLFLSPERETLSGKVINNLVKEIKTEQKNDWIQITGILNKNEIDEDSRVYLKVNGKTVEMIPQKIDGDEYGFCGYILKDQFVKSVEVIAESVHGGKLISSGIVLLK